MNPFLALLITLIVALVEIRTLDFVAHRGWISSRLSRKLIHILTGPLFVICWLLFPDKFWYERWLAALVPLLFTVQFALIGLGIIKDDASVKAMSRSGDRREILRGPLFYGIIFVVMTLIYWKTSPIGMTAVMLMCGGDGLADIVGRGLKSGPLPWSKGKTWFGSLGMLFGGFVLALVILFIFHMNGALVSDGSSLPFGVTLLPLAIIALTATLVESLPLKDVDNITVTLGAVALGHLLF